VLYPLSYEGMWASILASLARADTHYLRHVYFFSFSAALRASSSLTNLRIRF